MENFTIVKGSKENEVLLRKFPATEIVVSQNSEYHDLVGTVDPSSGTISVAPGKIITQNNNNGTSRTYYFYVADLLGFTNEGYPELSVKNEEPILLTLNEEKTAFMLPETTVITMESSSGSTIYGYYQNAFIPPGPAWIDRGVSEWTDGMITSFLSQYIDNPDEKLQVRTYENSQRPGYYRFIKPWAGLHLFSDGSGPVVNVEIDATNPGCVIVPEVGTGVTLTDNTGIIYVQNAASFYHVGQEGFVSLEDFLARFPEMNATLTDGEINVPGAGMIMSTPFLANSNPEFPAEGKAKNTIIKLSIEDGIETVTDNSLDNTNLPVEYFNIQGQRISNPVAGQMVIRRQGSDVRKLIIR